MPKTRVDQLKETIVSLRVRGLADRKELNAARHQLKEMKAELKAAQAEIELLRNTRQSQGFTNVEVICLDSRQYESLSLSRALEKGFERYGSAMAKLAEND